MIILGGCISSAKYNMRALVLKQGVYTPPTVEEPTETGHWETQRHPVTGEAIRVWVIDEIPDDPDTPVDESFSGAMDIWCQANAVVTRGLNSQGSTQRWTTTGEYENIEFVEMRVPAGMRISKRDRVMNIRDGDGKILWMEEELAEPVPTVFAVLGVAPSVDIFNRHIEDFVLLSRAENQENTWETGGAT